MGTLRGTRIFVAALVAVVVATLLPAAVLAVAPDAPTAVNAAASGPQAITITWAAPVGGDPVVDYRVTLSSGAVPIDTSALTATFTNLPRGVTYTAAVVARNADGDSSPAASGSVDLPAVAPGAPSITAGGVTSSSVSVNWSAAAANGSAITEYRLSVSPGGQVFNASGPGSHTFTGLSPSTAYTVSVVAVNGVGTGPSDSVTQTTSAPAAQVPGAPSITAGAVTSSSVSVNWSAAAANGSAITEYRLSVSPGGQVFNASGPGSHTFTGLSPSTAYTVSVVAVNGVGTGPSDSVSQTTSPPAAQVPGVPVVSAGAVTSSSVSVSWTAPAANGSAITQYRLSVSPGGQTATTTAGDLSHTFSGLVASTAYTVTVVAVNGVGPGTGGTRTLTTAAPDPAVPGAPTNVSAVGTAPFSRSVVVSWVAPGNTGSAALTGFVVTLDGATLRPGAGETSVEFSGVAPGSHQPSVRATNAVGPGPIATAPAVEVRAFPPYNSEAAFVTQQYADFLGRAPDAGGLTHWQGVTRADGANVDDVILSFMRSPEFSPRRAASRLYLAYFDRRPEKAGLDFWTAELATGRRSLDDVSEFFARSPEIVSRYGQLNDQEFVALVYNNVLGRSPDLAGYNFWLLQLGQGMTRGRMMIQFSESREFVNASSAAVDVILTYNGMLGRQPDDAGFIFWVGRVTGQPDALRTLIRGFFASPEYAGRIVP